MVCMGFYMNALSTCFFCFFGNKRKGDLPTFDKPKQKWVEQLWFLFSFFPDTWNIVYQWNFRCIIRRFRSFGSFRNHGFIWVSWQGHNLHLWVTTSPVLVSPKFGGLFFLPKCQVKDVISLGGWFWTIRNQEICGFLWIILPWLDGGVPHVFSRVFTPRWVCGMHGFSHHQVDVVIECHR